ncbi:MAG: hypothetical protein RLZZ502_1001 [Pseudomonadota bacterium]
MSKVHTQTTLEQAFLAHFHMAPELSVRAPGRVNLIGEHTDYNQGYVLPCVIPYFTYVACAKRNDHEVHALALDFKGETDRFALDRDISAHPSQPWSNYLRGMVQVMQQAGQQFGGMNIAIAGNVPLGAGLSSSAAFEVALGRALQQLYALPVDAVRIAQWGQATENQFVGCQCGIMDQMVCAVGEAHSALLLDCGDLSVEHIPIPEDLALIIVHSGVKRGLVDSAYNMRREQCESVAEFFGQTSLRTVSMQQLQAQEHALPALAYRRARHVLSENARVLAFAQALRQHDLSSMGVLMAQSHESMRADFEITTPEVDQLVTALQKLIGPQGGARMTGGGFGGCCVGLLKRECLAQVIAALPEHYQAPDGQPLRIFTMGA